MWTKVVVAILVVASGGACTTNEKPPQVGPTPRPEDTPRERGSVPSCSEDIPFEATYLPQGFGHETFEGVFPDGGRAERRGQVVIHYRGPGGRAIEVRQPGTEFAELAQGDDAPTIKVLGTETSGFAPIQPGGDDFIVQFTYPSKAKSTNHCAIYSLNEYGLSLAELKKVAEALRVRPEEKPFKLLIHCGLSYPLRFDGRDWLPVEPRLRRTHNPPEGFGSDENYDRGTILRIDDDTIIYTSSEGVEVEYEPTKRQPETCE